MPLRSDAKLPGNVRNALPVEAANAWLTASNSALILGKSEESAIKIAWDAVKKDGWMISDGAWKKQELRETNIDIKKTDEDERLVFGWLSVANTHDGTPVVDSHGDVIDIATLEKAAYNFVLDSRQAGEMHRRIEGVGHLVESCLFDSLKREALGIAEGETPDGWWVGFKIFDDDVWRAIKSGEYSMFSIGGIANPEAI